MQTTSSDVLPKRSRYYQSVIDINLMEKGVNYSRLKRSYVIFICTFDPFDRGRHIYHFENLCREDPSIRLADETGKIFLNTKGTMDDVDGKLRNLLNYFESSVPQDSFTRELDDAVNKAREHKEWRREYMNWLTWETDIREEARAEGRAEAIIELLEDRFHVPKDVKQTILSQTDLEKLQAWLKLAVKSNTLEEWEKAAGLLPGE